MLAKNVYEGVKQRMSQLQADVREREERLAAVQSQLGTLALEHDSALRQVKLEQQVSIAVIIVSLYAFFTAECGCVLSSHW